MPQLAMYRSRISSFHHAQLLTGGNPIGFSALVARLNDGSANSIEAVSTIDGMELMGQVQHTFGNRSARLTFITPEPEKANPALMPLLEFLCAEAGELSAVNLLAEVRESDQMIEVFRRCGFSIYGWETIWLLPAPTTQSDSGWRPCTLRDESGVRSLYQTLVPSLVQSAEPYHTDTSNRLVYQQGKEILAFVESMSGSKGIYLMPVIHPSLDDASGMLDGLRALFCKSGRPVYMQMRSYQAWMTSFLEQMDASTSAHFALMTHRLAVPQYAAEQNGLVVKNRHAETTAPIIQKTSRLGQ